MTRRRLLIAGLAVLAWTVWAAVTTPRRAAVLDPRPVSARPVVRGAYHVHSLESDGTGSLAEIAAAAARAGLNFVIVTDHGDATRVTRPPRYYSGVLCLEEVEISTSDGHYVALGLPTAPYPLGGEGRDVVEDVARLGGMGIAAHPDSAKPDLQWREWTAPIAGVEWLNGDSQWRDEQRWSLPPTLVRYLFRPGESVASLFDRPDAVLARWDTLTQQRRVVGLAGHDAHQRLGLRGGIEPDDERLFLKLPAYEHVFRSFTTQVELDRPFEEQASLDAPALLAAIRAGRVYTAIDAVASPVRFSFEARVGDLTARMGDSVPLAGPIAIRIRSNAPPGSSVALFRNGLTIDTRSGGELDWFGDLPGVYRVEVYTDGAPGHPAVPWIVSNPIYVGVADRAPAVVPPAPAGTPWPPTPWIIEKDPSSTATVTASTATGEPGMRVDFVLGSDGTASPFVAVVTPGLAPLRDAARLALRVTADRPLRASVQVRGQSSDPDERWRRSFYADASGQDVIVPLSDLRPVRPDRPSRLDPERIGVLMFVIDTVNTRPGTRGRLTVERLRTER